MVLNKHVFLALTTAAYAAVVIVTFDALYDSAGIPYIALVGLCGWFYGIRAGLFATIPYTLLNAALVFFVSSHPRDVLLACNPVGILVAMSIGGATGALKDSCDKLDTLRSSLTLRVIEATSKLDKLTRQLIENDEQERIQIGQDLHDGVGQYLTGMLLHSEAMSLSLNEAGRSESGLAEWMTRRVQKNIQAVRQLSRSLLPIQFSETNLETALSEMVAFFSEFSSVDINLTCQGNSTHIPIPTAQHLHRITHEALYRAIFKHKVTVVDITLITGQGNCRTIVNGSGAPRYIHPFTDLISKVMKYRIESVGGNQIFTVLANDGFRLECSVSFKEESA